MSAPEGATTLNRERLAKLCGIFGSDHPGERANAAAAADRLVREAGLRWPDIIVRALPSPPPPDPPRKSQRARDRELVEWCASMPEPQSAWERQFIWGIRDNQSGCPSPKQRVIVERIAQKIRAYYGRGGQ